MQLHQLSDPFVRPLIANRQGRESSILRLCPPSRVPGLACGLPTDESSGTYGQKRARLRRPSSRGHAGAQGTPAALTRAARSLSRQFIRAGPVAAAGEGEGVPRPGSICSPSYLARPSRARCSVSVWTVEQPGPASLALRASPRHTVRASLLVAASTRHNNGHCIA